MNDCLQSAGLDKCVAAPPSRAVSGSGGTTGGIQTTKRRTKTDAAAASGDANLDLLMPPDNDSEDPNYVSHILTYSVCVKFPFIYCQCNIKMAG